MMTSIQLQAFIIPPKGFVRKCCNQLVLTILDFRLTGNDRAKNNSKSDQILTFFPLPLRPILIAGINREKDCVRGHRRELEIALMGLKPGVHEYVYETLVKSFDPF